MFYNDFSPLPVFPSDNEDPEQAFRHGCFSLIAYGVGILLFFLGILLFSSCSTHKTVCGVNVFTADTLSQQLVVSSSSSAQQNDSIYSHLWMDSGTFNETDSFSFLDEIITERIVTFTDSLGQTTQTIDRISRRKQQNTQQQSSQNNNHVGIDYSANHMTSLQQHDSLEESSQQSHVLSHDSINSVTDRTPAKHSFLDTLIWIVKVIVFYVLCYIILTAISRLYNFLYKKYRSK